MKKLKVTVPSRLLSFVKDSFELPTKDLRWSIEHGRCFVNGDVERFSSTRVRKGDEVVIWPAKRPVFKKEEKRVLFEDEEVLFYNKPPYITSSDLAKMLDVHLVHRLDRDTTGVILFAKNNPTPYEKLFQDRRIEKTYFTLVEGVPKKKSGYVTGKMRKIGTREGAVIWGLAQAGSWSHTDWECEESGKKYSFICCRPLSGRTHQIRVHMRSLGHPVIGDCEYGNRKAIPGLFRPLLHARELKFGSYCVTAPLPSDFRQWKEKLL